MTKDEIKEKLSALFSSGYFKLFEGRFFDNKTPIPIVNPDNLTEFERLTIWVNNDHLEAICSSKGAGVYENKFLFDSYKDPVLEFDNCRINNKLISPGRLFYKAGWIDNDQLRLLHSKMCSKAVRIFNKGLVSVSSPFKISPGVSKLIADDHEIELGQGGRRINKSNISGVTFK